MPRRASSGINPGVIVGAIVFIVLVVIAGKLLIGRKDNANFRNVRPLDVEAFLENGNSMRGNEYSVKGTVDEKLRWTPDRGQVISLKVETNGHTEYIGIEIPPEFNHLNIEREQRYAFKVRIRKGGIPVATAVQPM